MSDSEEAAAADERLEACLRLAAQMHALSGLYQGVVHDLKSPLNTLAVNLELLRATLEPDAPQAEKQQRYARVLHEELMRLNRSIESLLPAAAPARPEPERFDLRKLVAEVAAFVAPQARQQKVTIEAPHAEEEDDDDDLPVVAHRDRLKQALLAVVVNSLEAMPDGGGLSIEARAHQTADGPRGRIVVSDTGPGVPERDRDRIYELYFSTKEHHDGIGLYVARQVVKSTNGSIDLLSASDGGARCEIDLPLSR